MRMQTFEQIVDQIIDLVTIKEKPRLIDQDKEEDNVSYDESNRRLTGFCLVLAIFLSIFSIVCLALTINAFEAQAYNVQVAKSATDNNEKTGPRVPHVLFMDSMGNGEILVFKQVNQSFFKFAWDFKVPKQKGGRLPTYFVFEDLGDIHVAYSNRKLKMTTIQSSSSKHLTVPRSEMRQAFDGGHSVRIGNFFMVFGGENSKNQQLQLTTQCSSVDYRQLGKPMGQTVTSDIFSIKRQVWIKGPFLPFTGGCLSYACGASLNRTHGIILNIYDSKKGLRTDDDRLMRNESCLDGFIFSNQDFQWVSIKKCLITLKNLHFITQFSCTSYQKDKTNQIQIVALLAQDINNNGSPVLNRFIYPETKIFLVDPLTLTSKDISISSSVLYSKSITLFSLRNQLYSAGEFDLITRFYRLNLSNCSMDTLVDVPHVLQLTEESTTFVMSLPF